jgi:hypothetical protein
MTDRSRWRCARRCAAADPTRRALVAQIVAGLVPRPAAGAAQADAAGAGDGKRVVILPREWLLDPASPHLRERPVDAPWDDPSLLRAPVAMRHEV